MIRIIRKPGHHYVEINMDGRVTKKDISSYSNKQKTKLAHNIFQWRKSGFVGYPDLSV